MKGLPDTPGRGRLAGMRPLPVLKPECSQCAALCCMALAFDAGPDFGHDKPALHPCRHLAGTSCTIHARLAEAGYSGCARFDCLGAGQRLMAEVFPGADWQADPALRAPLAEGLAMMRAIHGALELLVAARALPLPGALADAHAALLAVFHPPEGWTPETLRRFDLPAARARLRAFLDALRPLV